MAMFDFLKKKPKIPSTPTALPTDQVIALRQQGYMDDQIVQSLQQQGYLAQQIYDAIAQSQAPPVEPYVPSEEPLEPMPPEGPTVEETVESVIEEKWHDLTRELGKTTEWREKTDTRLDKLEQSTKDIKTDLDSLHKAIIGKISEYDKSLLNVGTEIKVMEKVFQKILPELSSNVQQLSRMTKTKKTAKK